MSSWRDVLRQTAEMAVQWCGDQFEEQVVAELPGYFAREPFSNASHQLDNGWWMYVNLSADTIKQLCSSIIEAIDIPEEEYDVELW